LVQFQRCTANWGSGICSYLCLKPAPIIGLFSSLLSSNQMSISGEFNESHQSNQKRNVFFLS
jgi:hypothetical protein